MPLSTRRQRRPGIDIWPGFVDALAQLVMIIVFVLLIFTAGQFYLTDALSGRDAALQKLSAQVEDLANLLSMERGKGADLQSQLAVLSQRLQQATQERDQAAQQGAALQAQLQSSQQQAGTAQTTVDQLNLQVAALRDQLAQIEAALETTETADKSKDQQIADLGQRLNQALLSKVEELARYRSEFFGRLRDALGDRPDIQVVGDRFVFQSEVLFAPASADLSDAAKARLKIVADGLKDVATKIPADIPWVLRVDGHTDKRPINTAQFPSNWELSSARAISVVNYLISQGIPADRLAAAGFGEYQPIDPADTEDAYSKNRRIELKLTER